MPGWSTQVRKRAAMSHRRKKLVRKQLRHLRHIKSKAELHYMILSSRRKQR